MSGAALKIRQGVGNPNAERVVDISVSVDGSWQKRYGFNSLHGIVFAMSTDHGLILDYAVKSLVCFTCKKTPKCILGWERKTFSRLYNQS